MAERLFDVDENPTVQRLAARSLNAIGVPDATLRGWGLRFGSDASVCGSSYGARSAGFQQEYDAVKLRYAGLLPQHEAQRKKTEELLDGRTAGELARGPLSPRPGRELTEEKGEPSEGQGSSGLPRRKRTKSQEALIGEGGEYESFAVPGDSPWVMYV